MRNAGFGALRLSMRAPLLGLLLLMPGVLAAQGDDAAQRYDRAAASRMASMAPLVLNARITPHWRTGAPERFTYRRELGEGAAEFVEITAETGARRAAFDAGIVAAGISAVLGKPVDPQRLPFMDYEETAEGITFVDGEFAWACSTTKAACIRSARVKVGRAEALSPDGKWIAFIDGGNLWVRSADGAHAFALSQDAQPRYGYGYESEATTAEELFGDFKTPKGEGLARTGPPIPPDFLAVKWSPDSRKLLTHRLDERGVREISITQNAPTDGTARPITWTWKSAAPGDAIIPMAELWVFDIAARSGRKLAVDPAFVTYFSPGAADELWWQPDSRHAGFIRHGRYKKSIGLQIIDTEANRAETPITETGATFVEVASIGDRPMVHLLGNGDVIWYSQRSGYAHLYLHDGKTGALKRQLTRGEMAIQNLLHVDEARGLVYAEMNSAASKDDPYRRRVYRVRLSDGQMTLLTPDPADHHVLSVQEKFAFLNRGVPDAVAARQVGFSPSGRFFVEASSTTSEPTRFLLRRANGAMVTTLETTDVSRLKARGWQPPQRFSALAADGKTTVWGTIWKPADFDASRKYPVLDSIYPGPQISRTHPGFAESALDFFDPQMYAELDLIVVAVDGRGTPGRSKSFQDASYGHLGDAGGLDDHIAAIRQLGERYAWIDPDRVGILGSSGGGFATARALFKYPDFYKVGVADAGNHDNRGYLVNWGESYLGPDNGTNYADAANAPLAANLKGKLLLMHGDMDANVPPALTLQVADALLRANKPFEMLIVPNLGHGTLYNPGRPLVTAWNFLTRHLIGKELPADYQFAPPAPQPAAP